MSIDFEQLYTVAETGVSQAAVPEGEYDTVVSRSDPYAQSNMIYLQLDVLNGPMQGKSSDVGIYFPKEGDKRGTQVFFAKKMGGFMGYPDVKAALLAARNAPTEEQALELIAGTLMGKQVSAKLTLREEGQYAGTNQLEETKRIGESPATAPATEVAQAPAIPAPDAGPAPVGGDPF